LDSNLVKQLLPMVMRDLKERGISGAELNMARARATEILTGLSNRDYLGAIDYVAERLGTSHGLGQNSYSRESSDRSANVDFLTAAQDPEVRKKGLTFFFRGRRGKEGD
jgi:hypothetical protein